MDESRQRQPRVYETSEIMKAIRPGPADSPPPNCAICLGTCTNKCFTDCCLHQFCFNCLLEWSKIKAECPLCKQPFKSIIHNIKPNLEYEEHIITNPERERETQGEDLLLDEDIHTEYLFLPNGPRPQRHFQFRTTLTLEPGGEFAIQQLLLSHPSTNSLYLPTNRYNLRETHPTLNFRRAVYNNGWWVDAQPDITGRYRECTPNFFRENPAQTHRIMPWVNRELTVLLRNPNELYVLQDSIMDMLCQYPILSASFRTRVVGFLGDRTDHFIHEFYNFVRSPYDMIGYDRHVSYLPHQPPVVYSQALSDDDSDVRVVDSPNDCIYVPPRSPEIIVINSEDSSDSDVVIRTPPRPLTPPPTINLLDSDTDDNNDTVQPQLSPVENNLQETREPQLPIKIRLKLNRNSTEFNKNSKRFEKKIKVKICKSESDSDSCDPKSDSEYSTAHISSSSDFSSSDENDRSTSSNDWIPVKSECKYVESYILRRNKKKASRSHKSKCNLHCTSKSCKSRSRKHGSGSERCSKSKKSSKKSSKHKRSKKRESDRDHSHKSKRVKRIKREYLGNSHSERSHESSASDDGAYKKRRVDWQIKTEVPEFSEAASSTSSLVGTSHSNQTEDDLNAAGPSKVLRSFIVKNNMLWYSRPDLNDQSTDNNSD